MTKAPKGALCSIDTGIRKSEKGEHVDMCVTADLYCYSTACSEVLGGEVMFCTCAIMSFTHFGHGLIEARLENPFSEHFSKTLAVELNSTTYRKIIAWTKNTHKQQRGGQGMWPSHFQKAKKLKGEGLYRERERLGSSRCVQT